MADEETKVTKPTRYYLLRCNRRLGTLTREAEMESRGAEAAISRYLDTDGVEFAEDETIVAVPVSNWTERGAKIRNVRTVELVELGRDQLRIVPDEEPVEDDGA